MKPASDPSDASWTALKRNVGLTPGAYRSQHSPSFFEGDAATG